jgi:C4-dicarboxylate-specific signal transduction histidine kinase
LKFVARRVGTEVHVLVSDTGAGTAPGARLFEPFQSSATGVGLGLYVSRAVLRNQGGDLKHEETAAGCTFCVKLPVADERLMR